MRPWHCAYIELWRMNMFTCYLCTWPTWLFCFSISVPKCNKRAHLLKFDIGAAHHFNWKKIGLSEAYFKSQRVCEDAMPTMKAKAAFIFIRENNGFYRNFLTLQHQVLDTQGSKNMSSYDLFIVHHGIECAMFPHLYPMSQFTDTGILQQYMEETQDHTNRVVSIGPLPFLHAVG